MGLLVRPILILRAEFTRLYFAFWSKQRRLKLISGPRRNKQAKANEINHWSQDELGPGFSLFVCCSLFNVQPTPLESNEDNLKKSEEKGKMRQDQSQFTNGPYLQSEWLFFFVPKGAHLTCTKTVWKNASFQCVLVDYSTNCWTKISTMKSQIIQEAHDKGKTVKKNKQKT